MMKVTGFLITIPAKASDDSAGHSRQNKRYTAMAIAIGVSRVAGMLPAASPMVIMRGADVIALIVRLEKSYQAAMRICAG